MPPDSYAEVVEANRQALAQATLSDPDSHFPYKHDVVTALIEQDGPMGPGAPGVKDGAVDDSRTVADYMSQGIADATRDYVDAQAAYVEDGGLDAYDEFCAARDRLLAARLDHRQNRPSTFTVGAAARRAG